MTVESQSLIRHYAAGEIGWSLLRQEGFDDYQLVLPGLDEFDLRPPMCPMHGPTVTSRERSRAVIREALETTP